MNGSSLYSWLSYLHSFGPEDRQERMSSISQQISEILSSLMNGLFLSWYVSCPLRFEVRSLRIWAETDQTPCIIVLDLRHFYIVKDRTRSFTPHQGIRADCWRWLGERNLWEKVLKPGSDRIDRARSQRVFKWALSVTSLRAGSSLKGMDGRRLNSERRPPCL